MIYYGVTAFADHYFYADQICEAVLKTGIKADVAPTVFGMTSTFEADLEDASDLIKNGATSSNTLNPLEQARIFALVGKLNTGKPTDFDLKSIWRMLMNGHKALPFYSGKIRKGYSADLIVWDLNNGATEPLYNPLAAIIYSSEASNIIHTIVDDRLLKKNRIVQIDEKETLHRLRRIANDIIKRGKGATELKF